MQKNIKINPAIWQVFILHFCKKIHPSIRQNRGTIWGLFVRFLAKKRHIW